MNNLNKFFRGGMASSASFWLRLWKQRIFLSSRQYKLILSLLSIS